MAAAAIGSLWLEVRASYAHVDAAIDALVHDGLRAAFGVDPAPAKITAGLPLVDSPAPVVLAVSAYLTIVLGGALAIRTLGLKPLAREPAPFRAVVVFHNLLCFALSLLMCCGIVHQAVANRYTLWGNAFKEQEVKMAKLIYLFYVSKYVEFFDTIIMVLKRNMRQISVLHVYHHSSIALIWWLISYHAPGGEAYFSAALNSGVHVVMYLYYLIAAILPKNPALRQKYLWWGRYLTQLQMTQFAINMVQAFYNVRYDVPYPVYLNKLLFVYMISLLALFANFYVNKYIRGPAHPVKAQTKSE
eukprot:SM000108S14233  [mRNA]  locus=s108:337730:340270:- [translate_table: standard]